MLPYQTFDFPRDESPDVGRLTKSIVLVGVYYAEDSTRQSRKRPL